MCTCIPYGWNFMRKSETDRMSRWCHTPSNLDSSKKLVGSKVPKNNWGQNRHNQLGRGEWKSESLMQRILCKTNHPKTLWLKSTTIYLASNSVGQPFGSWYLDGFCGLGWTLSSARVCLQWLNWTPWGCHGPQPTTAQMLVTGIPREQVPTSGCFSSLTVLLSHWPNKSCRTLQNLQGGERLHFLMGGTKNKSPVNVKTQRGEIWGDQLYHRPHSDMWKLV